MPSLSDYELLADFARSGSEEAFATVVGRHINLVYSTAARFTGNSHHAEEITQAVFIILTHKAGKLSPKVVLSGWLYQTTRLTAANFMKAEIRRQRREQEAYMQSTLNDSDSAAWQQIAPLLEDAMGRLGETDRNAVVLRFFENKTAAQVASTLNLTEAAAHKRTNRALEKLRKIFSKHGVSSTTSIIAGAMSAHSIQSAPCALAKFVTAVAAAKGVAASGSIVTLVKGALKLMAWTKAKTAIIASLVVLLTAGSTVLLIRQFSRQPDMTTLQGTWVGQEIGAPGQATIVVNGSVLEFRGADRIEWYKATFSLQKNTTPKQALITIADCPRPDYVGKSTRVIYKLEGDTFTVAGNEPGDPSLPESFDASTARKFVLKKQSASTAPILTATALAGAPNNLTSPPLDAKNGESIPGWGNVINPDGDCTLALSGEKLTMSVPGTEHILTPEAHVTNAPRVMQEVTGPFDMQVKVTSHFTRGAKTSIAGRNPYQGAGLLVWMNDANNLKLTPAQSARDGKGVRFFNLEFRHDGHRGGMPLPKEAISILGGSTFYLRLQIHKDQTTASVSADGVKWFSTSLPGDERLAKMQVGLIAENTTTSPLAVDFEEFALKPQ
jgi:RNA polymerase sigma factor (sigma-70 family)